MKFNLTFLLLFIFTTAFFGQSKNDNYPIMEFEQTTIDYGKVNADSNARRFFKFTNTGNKPLIITTVKGSCGCVVLNYPKQPIMPNEKGEIEIIYNVLKVGRISRTVTVTANTKKPIKVLKIKGRVLKKLNSK